MGIDMNKKTDSASRRSRREIQLSDHFTYGKLLRFTMPSILMMIFTSIYGMVDGFFVSNYVGATPFAALNLAMPFIMIMAAVGYMFGTGGTALVSMTLGMGDKKRANELFSLIVYVMIGIGLVLSVIGIAAAVPVARALGATDEMLPYSVLYIRINMISLVPFMLQDLFKSFLITAERPRMGMYITIAAGITNMVLDYLFVGVLGFGLAGAAWATVTSELVGGIIPLIFFLRPNSTILRLGRTHMDGRAILKACTNGSSEFLTNIASSLVGMLYNRQLLRYAGANGVAAYGVIMYVNFIFVGIYYGYSLGVSPVISYHYGAQNTDELKGIFRRSIRTYIVSSVILTAIAELMAPLLVRIFVGYDAELMAMTVGGFRIYSLAFLFMGFNLFGSALFTALNNGGVSAFLSVVRSLVLQVAAMLLLPIWFGLNGLWAVVVATDALCLILTITLWVKYRKRYQYA